jgi:hypothetical protein
MPLHRPAGLWAHPLVAALAALTALPLGAQGVVERQLSQPETRFEQPFEQIIALRELPGGRVVVTDVGARTVLLADFTSGDQTTIGRNGQGPGEYQFPGEVFLLRDTVFVVDRVSRRFLLASTDGKMLGKTIPFPEGIKGIPEARALDARGRVYFQASPFGGPGDDDGPSRQLPDSTVILRWDRASNRVDTLGKVKIPSIKMNVTNNGNARMIMMRPQPYALEDDWTAGPDGRVAVSRVLDYHVEWFGEGPRVAGPPVAVERRKVTQADKDRFMSAMKSNRNRMVVTNGPGGSRELRPPEPDASEFEWPEYMPAFRGRGMVISPEGQVWVTRQGAGRDTIPTYDVFDGRGALISRVKLPAGRRLAGLGQGVLYAVNTDEDGVQWLERYRR